MGSDKTVLDVIDYPSIANTPFVQIYAGVGSGKSYFAERFIEGDEEHGIPKKTVLIVTSRRSKVDQTLSDKALDISSKLTGTWGEYHWVLGEGAHDKGVQEHVRTLESDWGTYQVFQKSTICTNAFLEAYQKKIYYAEDITTHLWELFDIIIIDEVHSVVMDATYQSAPFYVRELVNETIHRWKLAKDDPKHYAAPMCKQIILMTGTPDAIQNFSVPRGAVKLDLMTECRNVQPENVHPIKKEQVADKIVKQINAGSRIVYFGNHTKTAEEFCKDTSIPVEVVATSFSKEEKRNGLDAQEKEKMERVEASIRENESIPADVKLFVTTAKNKEGINITDNDIDIMYIESHVGSDVIQMAGRVRNGVKHLYIVTDSEGVYDQEWKNEAEIIEFMTPNKQPSKKDKNKDKTLNFNSFFEWLCDREDINGLYNHREDAQSAVYKHKELATCINQLCSRFPYLQYSYFQNRFLYYSLRKTGKKYVRNKNEEFGEIGEGEKSFWDVVHEWFPEANITRKKSPKAESQELLNNFLEKHPDKRCTEDEQEALHKQLEKIWGGKNTYLNTLLRRFCTIEIKRKGKDRKSENYYVFEIKERA